MQTLVNKDLEASKEEVKSGAVKQLVRWISRMNTTDASVGTDSVRDIDEELGAYQKAGFHLAFAFYLGEVPEGYGMIYILVHD